MNAKLRRLSFVPLLIALSTGEANAYTDPGTGALLWQLLLGAGVGFMFYFRRIVTWFSRKKGDS